ncbi:MAG TPA: N-acetylmuramoyl-L-alanine amidase [Armatimonadota bacterium]|jgi:N-acetyl-anhydromuramyl-L-alanine amidase AmpD
MRQPPHSGAPYRALWLSLLLLAAIIALTLNLLRHPLPPLHAQASVARTPALRFVSAPSPYFRPANGRLIDTVVLHYSSAINVDASRWSDPQLDLQIFRRYHVSAHYLIDRLGTVYQLVAEQNVAYHAGGSIMPAPDNRHNVNAFSIGIEMIATADSGYTDAEYTALNALLHRIKARYTITHIVGHEEIAGARATSMGLRRDRKEDPGPLFDWQRMYALLQR